MDEYEDAIIRLYQRADPDLTYSMEDRTRQFTIGLRDKIRKQVEIFCSNTIEEAVNRACAIEVVFSKNVLLSSYSTHCTGSRNENLSGIKAALT